MNTIESVKKKIIDITSKQLFGVLATSENNKPHTTIIAFHLSSDLETLYFATPRDTKKFRQLSSNTAVSFLIHNSSNLHEDTSQASGITITGEALELPVTYLLLEKFLSKHPHMKRFISSENTAFISVKISRFDIVERFQNVTVLEMKG